MEIENPNVVKVAWKPLMIERYSQLTDVDLLKKYSTRYLRKAIRVNTLKITVKELVKRLEADWTLTPVPWCDEGFWIEHKKGERTDIGNLLEHALGYIYVQDPASMIPPIVLDPKPGEKILDMCAAPGSKTTQMAARMQNKGVIIANDITHDRLASLGINVQRMGATIVIITQMQGQSIQEEFDRVLLDAPCSATGTIRRSPEALKTWNERSLEKITRLQASLLLHAWKILKPGGRVVYSTCSIEPEEDEEMIDAFLKQHDDALLLPIELKIKSSEAVTKWNGKIFSSEVRKTLRIFPQDNDTEGFFVAAIKKKLSE